MYMTKFLLNKEMWVIVFLNYQFFYGRLLFLGVIGYCFKIREAVDV